MIRQHVPPENGAEWENGPSVVMEVITDPEELARSRARWADSDRNFAWWQANAAGLFAQLRGQYVVIAGQEVFSAATSKEAWAKADAAHPNDQGKFCLFIPKEKVARIYAHRGQLAAL